MYDYSIYVENGGTHAVESFDKYSKRALALVMREVHTSISTDAQRQAVIDAWVALIDRKADGLDVSSERVGSVSLTYGGDRVLTDSQFIAPYLFGTGLTYRGV